MYYTINRGKEVKKAAKEEIKHLNTKVIKLKKWYDGSFMTRLVDKKYYSFRQK